MSRHDNKWLIENQPKYKIGQAIRARIEMVSETGFKTNNSFILWVVSIDLKMLNDGSYKYEYTCSLSLNKFEKNRVHLKENEIITPSE